MIINLNGVNVDTNTMRTNTEIVELIKANTANANVKILLQTIAINVADRAEIPFSLDNSAMLEYNALLFVFEGTIRLVASSSQISYLYLRIRPTGDSEGYFINLTAYDGKTCELQNAQLLVNGSNLYKEVNEDGSITYKRTYSDGVYDFNFEEGLNGTLVVMPSNDPVSIYANGTVKIYGIK